MSTISGSSGPACSRNDGRDRARIDQPRIDLVGHDPDAALLGEVEQRALLVGRHRPARGIARRVDEDRTRLVVDRIEHLLQVELPAAVRLAVERHILGLAAHQPGGRGDVRPDRRDDHDVVTGIEQKLAAEKDRLHAAGRYGEAVDGTFDAVEPLGIDAERRPQFGDAALPCIKGLASLQALGRPPRARSRASPGRPRRTTAAPRRDRRTPTSPLRRSRFRKGRRRWGRSARQQGPAAGNGSGFAWTGRSASAGISPAGDDPEECCRPDQA